MDSHLAILGGGNMARAIVNGALRAGLFAPSRLVVAELDPTKRAEFAGLGVHAAASGAEAIEWMRAREGGEPGQILLAVKPQSFAELSAGCAGSIGAGRRVVISIMAGVRSGTIAQALGGGGREIAVVRAMPNLPAQIGQGATAVCLGSGAGEGDDALACRLFAGLGPLVVRTQERMMDAFTALAGSGPAYLFYLAEAMGIAAERMGFGREEARAIVAQTLAGSGAMLAGAEVGPGQLRGAVTSKGGTTQAATEVMDARGVMGALVEAVLAAEARGRSLGGG